MPYRESGLVMTQHGELDNGVSNSLTDDGHFTLEIWIALLEQAIYAVRIADDRGSHATPMMAVLLFSRELRQVRCHVRKVESAVQRDSRYQRSHEWDC